MFTWCSKKLSTTTNVRYKSARSIDVFLWESDRDSAGSLNKFPLLPGVGYIASLLWKGLTVFHFHSISMLLLIVRSYYFIVVHCVRDYIIEHFFWRAYRSKIISQSIYQTKYRFSKKCSSCWDIIDNWSTAMKEIK